MLPEQPDSEHDAAFQQAATITLDLLHCPELAERWTAASVLPRMSIGALACHLGRQIVRADELLRQPTDSRPLPTAEDHYRRAAWVTSTSPDDPANDRTLDDAEAVDGIAALHRRAARSVDAVRELITDAGAEPVVLIPWQGWSLRRNDFLLTRMLEIVVHSDDLAVSLEVPTPKFPNEVFIPVVELLVALAAHRHGQSAVIGALSRAERAPRSIAAF